jgi:hypothetical protein
MNPSVGELDRVSLSIGQVTRHHSIPVIHKGLRAASHEQVPFSSV